MKQAAGFLLALTAAFTLAGCGYSHDEAKALKEKQRAAEIAQFKGNGFEVFGTLQEQSRASVYAKNCYTLKKIPDNGITYKGCIRHNNGRTPTIYNLEALERGPR